MYETNPTRVLAELDLHQMCNSDSKIIGILIINCEVGR